MYTNIATIICIKSHGCIQRALYNLLVSENIAVSGKMEADPQQVEKVGTFYVDVIIILIIHY